MPSRLELRRAFLLYILSVQESRYIYGYPGRIEADGTVTFAVPGRPGYIFVTIWRGGKVGIDKAVNGGANPDPNLRVQMERINGVLTILRPDPSAATRLYEDLASSAFLPPHVGSIGSGSADPIEGRRFIPGLLAPSTSGGLTVRAFPCFTQYGYFAGNTAFAIDDPSTSGTRAWVIVYLTSANVLTYAVSTTHHPGTGAPLSEALLLTEFTLPNNATPLGAVVVDNGGAVTETSYFADFRFHLSRNNLFDSMSALTSATPALGDLYPFGDVSDSNNPKQSTLQLVYNAINLLTAETTVATGDKIAVYDASGNATDSMTLEVMLRVIAALTNVTAALADRIPINDASDSNNAKYVTVQSIQDSLGLLSTDTPDPEVDSLAFFDNSGSATDRALMKNVPSALQVMKVKNTSGATAAAQDVGYINSAGEYKTTTTANDPNMVTGGCVVLVGAANNSDIYVMRRGRVTVKLNGNCSIGDYLFSSTTATQLAPSTTMRPELVAIAQTANTSGAGGTCEALLLMQRSPSYVTNTNAIFANNAHSDSAFTATINGSPTATTFVYTPVSGDEDVLNVASSSQLGKMRVWNTTRNSYRLITATNTGTNTCTNVSVSDSWANGDTITIESQTGTTGATEKAVEIDLSQMAGYPALAVAIHMTLAKSDTGAGGEFNAVHAYETWANAKRDQQRSQQAGGVIFKHTTVPLIDKVFLWQSSASGTGTAFDQINIRGFDLASP